MHKTKVVFLGLLPDILLAR